MITNLSEYFGVIKISGDDAKSFIQNQFSNDIELCDANTSQISSYNSPKGRVYATFRIINTGQAYLLITTADQIAFLVKRLSMFVLRSKVKISDETANIKLLGSGQDALEKLNLPMPSNIHNVSATNEVYINKADDQNGRYLILDIKNKLETDAISLSPVNDWMLAEVRYGMPHIFAGAEEEFVAQMLNLDLIDGINFKKGCYPGQEVIARMKYLGKVKKRLFHITWESDTQTQSGQNIFAKDSTQGIGQIVYSAKNYKDQYEALAVINIETVEKFSPIYIDKNTPLEIHKTFIEKGK